MPGLLSARRLSRAAVLVAAALFVFAAFFPQRALSQTSGSQTPGGQNIQQNAPQTSGPNSAGSSSGALETAEDFLSRVAETYATFADFQANLFITQGNETSEGVLYSKDGNKVRINFSRPAEQVMVSDGTDFYIYIPAQNTALYQRRASTTAAGSFTSKTGLDQLRSKYFASYADKPYFVPMDGANPPRQVMQIRMRWRSPSQSFRELVLSIGRDFLIYRVDAVTYNRQSLRFDFSNIQVNKGIPDNRFTYDPPATATVVENFLFEGSQ